MTPDLQSAPKADALPDCATPRTAEALRFTADSGQAETALRGEEWRNAAGTDVPSPGIVPEHRCTQCDHPVKKLGDMCVPCTIEHYDYDETDYCSHCGGEGFTYGCGWDWQCDTWDGDSCLCTQRCDWCNPRPLTPKEQAERAALGKVIADAFAPESTETI